MKITSGKGRATSYSDFYKSSGASTPGGKLSQDAAKSPNPSSPGANAFGKKMEDEEDEDQRKSAIRRRLMKSKRAKVK